MARGLDLEAFCAALCLCEREDRSLAALRTLILGAGYLMNDLYTPNKNGYLSFGLRAQPMINALFFFSFQAKLIICFFSSVVFKNNFFIY